MKRISKLMLFAGTLLAVSCSQDELMSIQHDTPIQFRADIARQTRAASYTVNTLNSFSITAWKDDPAPSNNAPIIENAEFVRQADVYKGGSESYYWPKDVDVKFYAYAPRSTASNGVTYVDALEVQVEPLSNTDNQVDLLYAANIGNKINNAMNGVTLNFRHAMSQIQIKVKNSNSDVKFNVTGWKIAGVDGNASFTYDDSPNTNTAASGSQNTFSRSLWSDNDDDFSASYSKTFSAVNVTGVNSSWSTLAGSAILIPQEAPKATGYIGSDPSNNPLDGAYLAIQYEALDDVDNALVAAGTWGCWPVDMDWQPGFRYIYTIDLAEYGYKESGQGTLDPISDDLTVEFKFVDVEIDEWQPTDDEDANKNVSLTKVYDPYLRFHTVDGMQTLYLVQPQGNETETKLEYSLDEGATWSEVLFSDNGTNGIEFGYDGVDVTDLLVRGKGFGGDVNFNNWSYSHYSSFAFEYDNILVDCEGSVGVLSDYEHPVAALTSAGQFYELFCGCICLRTAPDLPSTTLSDYCYSCMFDGCENLTSAPALPATVMTEGCYCDMFINCSSLTEAPSLPAMTLAKMCYGGMFYNCYDLTTAPVLPATTMAEACYTYMFSGCESLTAAPSLPALTMELECYKGMFCDCINLATAPALPAMTLGEHCYSNMFENCTSLTEGPLLPATVLRFQCYASMFQGCSNLASLEMLGETYVAIATESIYNAFNVGNETNGTWLIGVADNGQMYRSKNMTWDRTRLGVPNAWLFGARGDK